MRRPSTAHAVPGPMGASAGASLRCGPDVTSSAGLAMAQAPALLDTQALGGLVHCSGSLLFAPTSQHAGHWPASNFRCGAVILTAVPPPTATLPSTTNRTQNVSPELVPAPAGTCPTTDKGFSLAKYPFLNPDLNFAPI